MNSGTAELTEAEWTIIKCVWEEEPCTAPTVQGKLMGQTGWTYSTVRTLLDRMVGKGLLRAEKDGKLTIYRSATSRAAAQRGELLYALKHAFNNAVTPMVQCLLNTREVSREDLAELKRLIAEHEQAKEGPAPRSTRKSGRDA